MKIVLLLANAFLLGLAHALEPDHMAAVSTFLTRHPGRARAVRFCVRWGVGHMLPLLASVAAVAAVGAVLPARAASSAERAVGGMLLLLGGWVLREAWLGRLHTHTHKHDGVAHTHLHTHLRTPAHEHTHAVLLVGIVHGLAGSASVMVLALLAGTSSFWVTGAYVVTFSSGVILSMALYGWSAGMLLERVASREASWLRAVQAAAGCCSIALGVYWFF